MDGLTKAKAGLIWGAMTENERTGVRFGLFPADKMLPAEKAGYNVKDLSVALMEIATKNGGMIA